MNMEQLVEWEFAGVTEVLGENLPQYVTLSTTTPTWTDLGSSPDSSSEKPATNRLIYGTAPSLLRVALCSYEIGFALRKECRLEASENMLLRITFRHRIGKILSFRNEALQGLNSSYINTEIMSRRVRLAATKARIGEIRKAYENIIWKPLDKRPFGRLKLIWMGDIKRDLKDIRHSQGVKVKTGLIWLMIRVRYRAISCLTKTAGWSCFKCIALSSGI
jgi:hypothetical protein